MGFKFATLGYHREVTSFQMKVFISHSYEDRAVADTLASALGAQGLEAWTSVPLEKGADWKALIAKAISEAQGFVFLVGPQSEESRWQQVEWQTILESDWDRVPQRPMIPVLLGDVELPAFLADKVTVRADGAMNLPVDRILHLLRHPDETSLPVNYDQARREQRHRLDVLKQFAMSLKLADQHPEGHSFLR
jgi:hypothetical protein